MQTSPYSEIAFPVEVEYARCIGELSRGGILSPLPRQDALGVIGFDGAEYPAPSLDHVLDLFDRNKDLVEEKMPQGFDRLELCPLAMPTGRLVELLLAAIARRLAQGKLFRTRRSADDPLVALRVNGEKRVWIWDTLSRAFDGERLVYFPLRYSESDNGGRTKSEAIVNSEICAFPGWSVGLVESEPIMRSRGQGKIIAGRKELEAGLSPNEYLGLMRSEEYRGETGMTLEDFITEFLIRLEVLGEVSRDVEDDNALWCLGQYMKVPYADLVPTGRWHRSVGRVRLDMQRSNNKECTKSWGAATILRLRGSPAARLPGRGIVDGIGRDGPFVPGGIFENTDRF